MTPVTPLFWVPPPPVRVPICGTRCGLSSCVSSVTLNGNGTCACLHSFHTLGAANTIWSSRELGRQYGFEQHSRYRRLVYPLFVVEAGPVSVTTSVTTSPLPSPPSSMPERDGSLSSGMSSSSSSESDIDSRLSPVSDRRLDDGGKARLVILE